MSLAEKHCDSCRNAKFSLTEEETKSYLKELPNWNVIDNTKITKTYKLQNFQEALDLANKIGALAEEQGHHPDLTVRWGELKIELWTHKVNGLTEADFVMAAKIDQLN